MQRVAMLATAPREDLQVQYERRRALLRRRLKREAWMNGITALGLGACAGALLWRYASEIRWLATHYTPLIDPNLLAVGTVAALGALVWLLIKRAQSGR